MLRTPHALVSMDGAAWRAAGLHARRHAEDVYTICACQDRDAILDSRDTQAYLQQPVRPYVQTMDKHCAAGFSVTFAQHDQPMPLVRVPLCSQRRAAMP